MLTDGATREFAARGTRPDFTRTQHDATVVASLSLPLGKGAVSRAFAERGIRQLDVAARFVEALHYGRTSETNEPLSVLRESRGTCTLKHALLKLAAEEAGAEGVQLVLGIFEMSARTTPGIASVLEAQLARSGAETSGKIAGEQETA